MAYTYIAISPQGRKVQGRVDANTESAAEEILWKQQFTVISLKEVAEGGDSGGFLRPKVTTRDLAVLAHQLATLIASGNSIGRALLLLGEQASSKRLREILAEVVVDIQQGRPFSDAIAKHNRDFPPLFARMVEVGERAGNLESVLRQMATYMEKEEALVRKVKSAMTYPTVVTVLAIGVMFLMLTVALPPLMGLFTSFDAELPLPTRVLLALTNFFSAYKYYILGAMAVAGVGAAFFFRSEGGKALLDRTLLKIPKLGTVIVQGAVARMCRTTSTLLRAGISLPEILDMVIRTQSNTVIAGALTEVHSELLQGNGLAGPLAAQKVLPGMLAQMVRVGEETGSLDSNLETLAIFYEDEVDRSVSALTAALEPALTIFIGIMVGFVAVAVIMPMYSLMSAIN
jgi:type IV pilus assembly protein PilC